MATTRRASTRPPTRPTKPEPPTLVLFVRHGQTATTGKHLPGRAPGLHLSDAGREQAAVAAGRLAELPRLDAVYASPLQRARRPPARPPPAARRLPRAVGGARGDGGARPRPPPSEGGHRPGSARMRF